MSRLYDALKEARRRHPGNDNDTNRVWDALEGIDIPPETPTGRTGAPLPTATTPAAAVAVPEHVPHVPGADHRPTLDRRARLIPHAIDAAIVEHYRRLRTRIIQLQTERPFRSLIVTSANPQEGKTVTVLNLGLIFAMLPAYRVVVVDGDLRKGTVGKWLGVDEHQPGLTNVLEGSARLDEVLLKDDEIPVHFLLRGNAKLPPDVRATEFAKVFGELTEQFDLVLVDSPPINLIADAQLLAENCDAVLLIARAFSTTRKAFEKAYQDLSRYRILGTVLNAGTVRRSRSYYGYY